MRKLIFVPVDKPDVENAPDYRIHLGDDDGLAIGPEVGAGWKRNGEKAGDYVSLHLDGPHLKTTDPRQSVPGRRSGNGIQSAVELPATSQ